MRPVCVRGRGARMTCVPRVREAAGESPEARTTYYIILRGEPTRPICGTCPPHCHLPAAWCGRQPAVTRGVGPKTIVSDAVIETLPGGSPCQVKIALVPSRLAPAVETVVMEGAQWHLTLTASRLRERLRRACRWNW